MTLNYQVIVRMHATAIDASINVVESTTTHPDFSFGSHLSRMTQSVLIFSLTLSFIQ